MIEVVAKDIHLDDAPMERFEFSGGRREAALEADTEDGGRIVMYFHFVSGLRFAPMFDRSQLMVGGMYRRTLLELRDSAWLKDVVRVHATAQEPVPHGLRHYMIPSDDGVWEVLAKGVTWERMSGA